MKFLYLNYFKLVYSFFFKKRKKSSLNTATIKLVQLTVVVNM